MCKYYTDYINVLDYFRFYHWTLLTKPFLLGKSSKELAFMTEKSGEEKARKNRTYKQTQIKTWRNSRERSIVEDLRTYMDLCHLQQFKQNQNLFKTISHTTSNLLLHTLSLVQFCWSSVIFQILFAKHCHPLRHYQVFTGYLSLGKYKQS